MKPELSICALSSGDTSASKTVFRSRHCQVNLMVSKRTSGKNSRPVACADKNKNFWNPQITQITQIQRQRESGRFLTEQLFLICEICEICGYIFSTTFPIQVCTLPLEKDWSFFPVRLSLPVRVR